MKKNILLIFLCFYAFSANSQVFKAGFKGGFNMVNFMGDIDFSDMRYSYHAGIFTNLRLSESYALQPEIVFSNQGSKIKDLDYHFALQYLNIPIIGKFFLADDFNLQIGPQIGFLINDKLRNGETVDLKGEVRGTDISIAMGAGYQMNRITLDIRYNMGLSDVFDGSFISEPPVELMVDDTDINHQVIQISIGAML